MDFIEESADRSQWTRGDDVDCGEDRECHVENDDDEYDYLQVDGIENRNAWAAVIRSTPNLQQPVILHDQSPARCISLSLL